MAIILAINGFNVLTGEPENEPENHHYEEHHEEHWLDWRESAKVVGVEHKINFQHLDAEDLLFSAESFDGIFMYDTLQHIQNKEVALNECIRVIKPDCIICIIE